MKLNQKVAILHYSAPPVVGGVEAVIQAHARIFLENQVQPVIIAGRGAQSALAQGAQLEIIPEIDSQHPEVLAVSRFLEKGQVPPSFEKLKHLLIDQLHPLVSQFDHLIVHNVLTKHFNLPLTAAIFHLLDAGAIRSCISWVHDITWTSANSRSKVFAGMPWDLLRTNHPNITSIAISIARQSELAQLYKVPNYDIKVIYNGVDIRTSLGIAPQTLELIDQLKLLDPDLFILMPIRITQAKNIETAIQWIAELKSLAVRPLLLVTGPPDPHDENSMAYFNQLIELAHALGVAEEVVFLYNAHPSGNPLTINIDTVSDLLRIADCVWLLSHREGFGMPILEAGLAGIPVVSTPTPAALEIGAPDVLIIQPDEDPRQVAEKMIRWLESNSLYLLRSRIKRNFTWQAIFKNQILPLLLRKEHGYESGARTNRSSNT